ncbi:MAG: hypothetical protein OEY14_02475 [Myxococcales bacterium]|nr:hypothetical protein [Myxococcales bacterium]
MKKVIVTVLLSTFVVGLLSFGADAQRRRRRRRQPAAEAPAQSVAIAPMLGELRWGWSKQTLIRYQTKRIQAAYRPRMHKAPGALEQENLRLERDRAIRRMNQSYVEFRGQTSGHDSGFLRNEFTHDNGEAMVRVRAETSEDYYFFINNRLWKWYRAFDASVYEGVTFEQFAEALQGQFGPARQRSGALYEGGETMQWLEWEDEHTRLRAIDNTTFYGFYCLVLESKETLSNLASLRRNRQQRGQGRHALVDAVTNPDNEVANPDDNTDVADRITGRIRNRQDAPED